MLYVKDRHTFATIKQCTVLGLDPLVFDATDDTTSNIKIAPGSITSDDVNNLAIFDDKDGVWVIKGTSQQDDTLSVTLEPVWRIFSRDHVYDMTRDGNSASKGAFIASVIQNEYIQQEDTFYAYPYITIVDSTDIESNAFKAPCDEDGDIYSLGEYIENAIKINDLAFRATFSNYTLFITIYTYSGMDQTVVFNDGHTFYEGSSFGEGGVSKVTVIQEGVYTDFYLDSNNNIVLTAPPLRVEGDWKLIAIGEDDVPFDEAEEEFKDTINSYKIEWASDREFSLGDNIRFQFEDGSIHYGKVTYKAEKTSDELYHYKAGTLKTTLTDKLRSVKNG